MTSLQFWLSFLLTSYSLQAALCTTHLSLALVVMPVLASCDVAAFDDSTTSLYGQKLPRGLEALLDDIKMLNLKCCHALAAPHTSQYTAEQ